MWNCDRPRSLEDGVDREEKQGILDRLTELDEKGMLDKLEEVSGQ